MTVLASTHEVALGSGARTVPGICFGVALTLWAAGPWVLAKVRARRGPAPQKPDDTR